MENKFMRLAIEQAKIAYSLGEMPVGAVIVYNNEVIAMSHNEREKNKNALHHAEILAIDKACNHLNSWRLTNCDIYVNLQPCPMCASAIMASKIRRLYFGSLDTRLDLDMFKNCVSPCFNHSIEVYSGIMQEECDEIINQFFCNLRQNN